MELQLWKALASGLSPDATVFQLFQNYPNPFNPETMIRFKIPVGALTKIRIYDILGREIVNLLNEYRDAGSYQVTFNGSNLSTGVYFYKLESGDFTAVKRMVLIK